MNSNTELHEDPGGPEALDALAGEYVLGTLSAAHRREVAQRLPGDAALREAVQRWQERLLPLAALAGAAEPSAQLWQRIEASVDRHAAAQAAAGPARGAGALGAAAPTEAAPGAPADAAPSAPPRRPAPPAASGPGWWGSLRLWRGLAGTGFAAAAVLASVLVTRVQAPPAPQYLVVLVAPQDKAPGWVVQAASTRQISLIPLGQAPVPAEKSLQFWTKGDGWAGPVSLGLVRPGQTLRVALDKLPPLQPNQLFELTLEPASGSPLDRPTGPIQFIGRAVKVL